MESPSLEVIWYLENVALMDMVGGHGGGEGGSWVGLGDLEVFSDCDGSVQPGEAGFGAGHYLGGVLSSEQRIYPEMVLSQHSPPCFERQPRVSAAPAGSDQAQILRGSAARKYSRNQSNQRFTGLMKSSEAARAAPTF